MIVPAPTTTSSKTTPQSPQCPQAKARCVIQRVVHTVNAMLQQQHDVYGSVLPTQSMLYCIKAMSPWQVYPLVNESVYKLHYTQ
jgi:hypothetical protein